MNDNSASLLGKIAGYTEILAKDPQSTVFVSLCEAYRQLGMLDDALEIAQKGTRSLVAFSPGFVALGRIHGQQGDLADAANAFEKALAIEKDSLPALKGLARTRYRQGYLDKAKALLLNASQINPQDPVVNKMLESLAPGKSKTASTEAASMEQQTPQADEIDVAATPSPEAVDVPVVEASPIPTATLAELYIKQGLLNEAAHIYRDILRQDPENEKARAMLVDLKQRMADLVEPTPVSPEPVESVAEFVADASIVEPGTPAGSAVSAPEPVVESETGPSQLEVYQRWLNAIEQRRAHVC